MWTSQVFPLEGLTVRILNAARIAGEFLLVILAVFLVTRIGWLLVAPGPAVSDLRPQPLPSPVSQSAGSDIRADLSLLVTENPFQASESASQDMPDAPETDLNLRLVALFTSTGDGMSSATIVTPDNETARYELGDEILPGVVLERVLLDRAIISRDGREETLMRSGRSAGLSVITDPAEVREDAKRVTTETPPLYEPGVSARTLTAGLEVEADVRNGRTQSLILRPRGDASLMNSAGLEPGDRLVDVNGTQVAEIDASTLASRLSAGGIATVSIIRGGETRTIEIRFEEE